MQELYVKLSGRAAPSRARMVHIVGTPKWATTKKRRTKCGCAYINEDLDTFQTTPSLPVCQRCLNAD